MEINVNNQQNDEEFGVAKRVIVKSFRQVTVFGENYTKIIYMHSPTEFSIEKVGDNINLDENVQVVSGPKAQEIIEQLIENEKKKGATMIWSGARFENRADRTLLKDTEPKNHWDPLKRDFVEPEFERRKYRRRKEDRENDELHKEEDRRKG